MSNYLQPVELYRILRCWRVCQNTLENPEIIGKWKEIGRRESGALKIQKESLLPH